MIVVTDEALDAGLKAYSAYFTENRLRGELSTFSEGMRAAIAAAADHLTDTGRPLTNEKLQEAYDHGYSTGRAEVRPTAGAAQRSEIAGWELPSWVGRTRNVLIRNASPTRPPDIIIRDDDAPEAAAAQGPSKRDELAQMRDEKLHAHLTDITAVLEAHEQLIALDGDARRGESFRRGWEAGQRDAAARIHTSDDEPISSPVKAVLETAANPSDYEVWRDALQLALQNSEDPLNPNDAAQAARSWLPILREHSEVHAPDHA